LEIKMPEEYFEEEHYYSQEENNRIGIFKASNSPFSSQREDYSDEEDPMHKLIDDNGPFDEDASDEDEMYDDEKDIPKREI
jgi:hypothetical protein